MSLPLLSTNSTRNGEDSVKSIETVISSSVGFGYIGNTTSPLPSIFLQMILFDTSTSKYSELFTLPSTQINLSVSSWVEE